MDKEINLKHLANSVRWWMSYLSAVGRNYILAESSIKYPIAEYLERSNVNNIELEFGHPRLIQKRFDLHYEDKNNTKTAIEFKFIKNGSTRNLTEKKRIFYDLMRLYLYLNDGNKGYILICGMQNEFSKDFYRLLKSPPKTNTQNPYITEEIFDKRKLIVKPKGFYSRWFSFDINNPEKEINLKVKSGEYSEIYQSFVKHYKNSYIKTSADDPGLDLPDSIKTKLIILSKDKKHEDNYYQPATIGIWEVTI